MTWKDISVKVKRQVVAIRGLFKEKMVVSTWNTSVLIHSPPAPAIVRLHVK